MERYGAPSVPDLFPRCVPQIVERYGAPSVSDLYPCCVPQIVERYGADALRLYLINSPVVRGESLRFKEEGVRDVLKDVFLPWYNAYRFLIQNVHGFEKVRSCSTCCFCSVCFRRGDVL